MNREDKSEARALHNYEVDEPQDALAEEAIARIACASRADPVKFVGEDDRVSSGNLPDSRHNHVESREEVLVHDVLPGHQQLVHEHLAHQKHHRQDQRGHKGLVSEARRLLVESRLVHIVVDASLLGIINTVRFGQFVELADFSLEHVFMEEGEHDGGGKNEWRRDGVHNRR